MKIIIVLLCVALASVCLAADYTAEVVGGWAIRGSDGARVSQLSIDYPQCSGADVVGSQNVIPDPNLGMWIIQCGNDTLTDIEKAGYTILWSERVPDKEVPK